MIVFGYGWGQIVFLGPYLVLLSALLITHRIGVCVQEQRDLTEYLSCTIDTIWNKYSHCGILVLRDFNKLNISVLTTRNNLKQVASKPTRNGSILDLILTDFYKFYNDPEILPPLGSSDHNLVKLSPLPVPGLRMLSLIPAPTPWQNISHCKYWMQLICTFLLNK